MSTIDDVYTKVLESEAGTGSSFTARVEMMRIQAMLEQNELLKRLVEVLERMEQDKS